MIDSIAETALTEKIRQYLAVQRLLHPLQCHQNPLTQAFRNPR